MSILRCYMSENRSIRETEDAEVIAREWPPAPFR